MTILVMPYRNNGHRMIRFILRQPNQMQYEMSMFYNAATDLFSVLDAQRELAHRSGGVSFNTTIRGPKRRTTIELSKTNGLTFTVTDSTIGKFTATVSWSYLNDWFNSYEGALSA